MSLGYPTMNQMQQGAGGLGAGISPTLMSLLGNNGPAANSGSGLASAINGIDWSKYGSQSPATQAMQNANPSWMNGWGYVGGAPGSATANAAAQSWLGSQMVGGAPSGVQ